MPSKQQAPALEDQLLLRTTSYVDGAWEAGDARKVLAVRNPATGATIAEVRTANAADTRRAIEAAHRAFGEWRKTTVKQRASVLRRWYELTLEAAEDLAVLMTAEQGKTLFESRGEIQYGASFIEWFAEQAKRADGDVFSGATPHTRAVCIRQPVGVVAAITPWNFPNAMIARKVAPALAAGCTVVVKPAEDTPLSALAMAELAERAGFPAGCFNVVVGDPVEIGAELTGSPLVRKLSFTGSTEVGKLLEEQCAPTLKRTTMELGGNAPFIVFDDADLDDAIAGALLSKYRNSGQTCVCANRFLVQDSVYDEFCERLVAASGELVLGNGAEEGRDAGPADQHRGDRQGLRSGPGIHRRGRGLRYGRQPRRFGRLLLPAHGVARRNAGHAGVPQRDLRTGRGIDPFQRRSRSRRAGERHRCRPLRLRLQPRHRPRVARGRGTRIRDGRHE